MTILHVQGDVANNARSVEKNIININRKEITPSGLTGYSQGYKLHETRGTKIPEAVPNFTTVSAARFFFIILFDVSYFNKKNKTLP